jgi:hypothetical protein
MYGEQRGDTNVHVYEGATGMYEDTWVRINMAHREPIYPLNLFTRVF